LRPEIKREAEAKISLASKEFVLAQGVWEEAEKRRRRYNVQSPLFLELCRLVEDARKTLDLSKAKLQQKDYSSIVEAKDLAIKAFDLALEAYGLRRDVIYQPLGNKHPAVKAAKKMIAAKRAAWRGGLSGAVIGTVGSCAFFDNIGRDLSFSEGLLFGVAFGILGCFGAYYFEMTKETKL